jgi:hypothetical protein
MGHVAPLLTPIAPRRRHVQREDEPFEARAGAGHVHGSTDPASRQLTSRALLQIQRTAGNRAAAALVVQRCGPIPCDCSQEERAAKEHDLDEQAVAALDEGHAAPPVQRQEAGADIDTEAQSRLAEERAAAACRARGPGRVRARDPRSGDMRCFDQHANACGPAGHILHRLIPNTSTGARVYGRGLGSLLGGPAGAVLGEAAIPRYDFTDACNAHDRCYGTPGATQQGCDDQMLADTLASCGDSRRCRLIAHLYHRAVASGGADAFNEAQGIE